MSERSEAEGILQPNQQRMDTIVYNVLHTQDTRSLIRPRADNPSANVTADDRATYLQQVADGRIGNEQYATFLSKLAGGIPLIRKSPEALFSDLDNEVANSLPVRDRMKRFLSSSTRSTTEDYARVDASDISTFFNEGETSVLDFERTRDAFVRNVEINAGDQEAVEYRAATDKLGQILYGRQWEYLQQIRLLESQARVLEEPGEEIVPSADSVRFRHVVFPAIEASPLVATSPRPEIGTDDDWRFVGGKWRLTPKGIQDVPRTEHELDEQETIYESENTMEVQRILALWRFDPGGRPSTAWVGTTDAGNDVMASFEQGAAHRESFRSENIITIDEYEEARDRIAKLDRGLFIFASYVDLAPSEVSNDLLQRAAGQDIDPRVRDYLQRMLPAFGMYKYVQGDISSELTRYRSSSGKVDDDGRRVINADDILGQWLREESQFSDEIRQEGRRLLFTIAHNFEAGSQNDSDWEDRNKSIVLLARSAGRTYRQEFSEGFGFGRPWESISEIQAHAQDQGQEIVNPWAA